MGPCKVCGRSKVRGFSLVAENLVDFKKDSAL